MKDGKSNTKYYTASITITLLDGEKKRLKFYGKTKEEAERKLEKAKMDIESGTIHNSNHVTFEYWLKEWVSRYIIPFGKKEKMGQQLNLINKYFLPYIGNIKLNDIKLVNLQDCANLLIGKSQSTISKTKSILNKIFEDALKNELLNKNIANFVEWSKGTKKTRRSLTIDERRVLETVCRDKKWLIFAVTYACGLRPAEARALKWSDIDFKAHVININSAVKRHSQQIGGPKSSAGIRTVIMPIWLENLLSSYPKHSIFVFANSNNTYLSMKEYDALWYKFKATIISVANKEIQESLQEITPYYLRHTYATLLREKITRQSSMQYMLGHSSFQTTEIYAHLSQEVLLEDKESIRHLIAVN